MPFKKEHTLSRGSRMHLFHVYMYTFLAARKKRKKKKKEKLRQAL